MVALDFKFRFMACVIVRGGNKFAVKKDIMQKYDHSMVLLVKAGAQITSLR